jgi:co-chaperonin GroES (HSP10)
MENKSGIHPCGDRILVKPDEIEEVTEGGIVIPDQIKDHHMDAQTSGILVAVGPDAWNHFTEYNKDSITVRGFSRPFAQVGDKIMFAKFGGQKTWGKDGLEYRVLNDVDITAIIEEGVTFDAFNGRKKGGVSKK